MKRHLVKLAMLTAGAVALNWVAAADEPYLQPTLGGALVNAFLPGVLLPCWLFVLWESLTKKSFSSRARLVLVGVNAVLFGLFCFYGANQFKGYISDLQAFTTSKPVAASLTPETHAQPSSP